MEMREVGSMREVGRCLFPKSDLIIKRLLFLRSKALHGGLGRVAGGEGGGGGRGTEGVLRLGFCSQRSRMRPWAVRPVLLPEGSQSWRVKSLQRA